MYDRILEQSTMCHCLEGAEQSIRSSSLIGPQLQSASATTATTAKCKCYISQPMRNPTAVCRWNWILLGGEEGIDILTNWYTVVADSAAMYQSLVHNTRCSKLYHRRAPGVPMCQEWRGSGGGRKGTARLSRYFLSRYPLSVEAPCKRKYIRISHQQLHICIDNLYFPSLNTSKPFPHAAALTKLNFSEEIPGILFFLYGILRGKLFVNHL